MTTLAADFSIMSETTFAPNYDLPPRELPRPLPARRAAFGAWCALRVHRMHLRLDDWMPNLSARVLGWLERRETDAASSEADQPEDPVYIDVDLEEFAAGLILGGGKIATPADAAAWLATAGFDSIDGTRWVGERDDLALLGKCGITIVRPARIIRQTVTA